MRFRLAENYYRKKAKRLKDACTPAQTWPPCGWTKRSGRWFAAFLRRSRRRSHGISVTGRPMLNWHANNSRRTSTLWKPTAWRFTALTPMKTIPIACLLKTKPSWLTATCCCRRRATLLEWPSNHRLPTSSWRPWKGSKPAPWAEKHGWTEATSFASATSSSSDVPRGRMTWDCQPRRSSRVLRA